MVVVVVVVVVISLEKQGELEYVGRYPMCCSFCLGAESDFQCYKTNCQRENRNIVSIWT
jgi:hypothetical protein